MSVSDARVYALREVVEGAESADSIIDRASLFSAARILLKDICEDQHSHSYICEKAYKIGVHLSASLRMGDSHGLSLSSHKKAALIELASLESALACAQSASR